MNNAWFKKKIGMIALLSVVCLQWACVPKNAKALWTAGLKKCAVSDLLGPNVVYLGPSNALGPGTIFQKFADGGIQPSHLLKEYAPSPDSLMSPAQTFTCAADSSSSIKLDGSTTLPTALAVSGSVSGAFSSASTVTVKAESLEWDQLVTGPYKSLVSGLPDSNSVKTDLQNPNQLVLSRALLVKGMTAVLEFKGSAGGTAKLSVPSGPVPKDANSNIGIDLSANWEGDTKLTLTATSAFYIAGELRHYSGGLAGGSPVIGPLEPNAGKVHLKR